MGRADLCGAQGAVPKGAAKTVVLVPNQAEARAAANPTVIVKGCKLTPGVYESLVNEIVIEETAGFDMSMAVVRLGNKDIADDDLWEEGAEMMIETGHESTQSVRRHGKFFLTQPKVTFSGAETLTLVGFGEEIKLGRTEKRRAFKKKTDSQIVKEIAGDHGFGTDVEETDLVHEQVLQANENDYKFLAKRARLHGFVIYLDDGKLHFHKPRPEASGIQLSYREGQASHLSGFEVETRTFLRGVEWKVTQVDPLRLDIVDEKSKDDMDEVTKALIQEVRAPRKWDELVKTEGERPTRFAVNQGHEQQRGPLKDQVEAFGESSRWVVRGKGSLYGVERMKPNQLIELIGLGKHSGQYYVTRVTHRIKSATYSMSFEVTRSFTGGMMGNRCSLQVVQPRRAGAVSFAG